MKPSNSSYYEFGDFRIDAGKRLLFKGENENLPLTPKVFDILLILVERQGETVAKDELLAAVWPDTIVEENNLSQNISVLRRALGEKRTEHRFIVTIPGRGYKFVAQVREIPAFDSKGPLRSDHFEKHPSAALEIERHGNVLALADWKGEVRESDENRSRSVPVATPDAKPRPASRYFRFALAAGGCVLVAGIASAFLWLGNRKVEDNSGNGNLEITRVTNGFLPYDATISHDGKYFVYHQIDGDQQRMWLQQTGHSIRIPILTTSELTLSVKTFSPDGQVIYYLATEQGGKSPSLYRIRAFGGNPTKILTDIDSYVSFSPDGSQMVFGRYDENLRELQFVIASSDGAGEERILYRRGFDRNWSGNAGWSPDGKTIIVNSPVVTDEGLFRCELVAISLQGGGSVPVSNGWGSCYRIEWRRDGSGFYLVGTRDGDQRFAGRDQIYFVSYPEGKFQRVTTEDSRHQTHSLGVTNDGSIIAAPFDRSSQIWVMDSSGDTRSAVQITTGNSDGRAGIAPVADGRVAFLARTGENLNIWSMNQDGSDLRQVNFDPPFVEEIRSSPGAPQTLIFSAPQGNFHHLFRINSDGSDMRQLTFGESFEVDATVSNDGRWLTFAHTINVGTSQNNSVRKMSMDGGEAVSIFEGCASPLYSPDDRFLSCVSAPGEIRILSASDGSIFRSIKTLPLWVPNFGAVWSPDGRSVVYIVNEKDDVSNLWQHPIDGSPPKRLTNFTTSSIHRFAYSFDGTRLFLARGQQTRDALLIKHSP